MKINIANPATGAQKLFEVDDEKKYRIFFDKSISEEVNADPLGDQFKGYILKITGGLDKQGFAMKQGVLTNQRVRLLLDGNHGHYVNRRVGDRRRKSVRGCIVSADMSVVNCIVVKKGEGEIEGLTDKEVPNTLGPKRASHIRKFFALTKEDDVRQFVFRRTLPVKVEGKKPRVKAPKIQRLITPVTLRRKRQRLNIKKQRSTKNLEQKAAYERLVVQLRKEKRHSILSRKRSQSVKGKSTSSTTPAVAAATTPAASTPAATTPAPAPAKASTPAPAKVAVPAKAAPAKLAAKPAAAKVAKATTATTAAPKKTAPQK